MCEFNETNGVDCINNISQINNISTSIHIINILDKIKKNKYINYDYEFKLLNLFTAYGITDDLINNGLIYEFTNYLNSLNYDDYFLEKDRKILFRTIIRYCLDNSIELCKIETIFTSIIYLDTETSIEMINMIKPKLDQNSLFKLNYRLCLFMYLKIISLITKNKLNTNILEIDVDNYKCELNEFSNLYKKLILNKIILNPIAWTKEFINVFDKKIEEYKKNNLYGSDEYNIGNDIDYTIVSFLDLFVHASFIIESSDLGAYYLMLIKEIIESEEIKNIEQDLDEKKNFYSKYTLVRGTADIDALMYMNNFTDTDNDELLDEIDKIKEFDPYKNYFLYWTNRYYLKYKLNYYFEDIIGNLIKDFYSKKYFESNCLINFVNEFGLIEITYFLDVLFKINLDILYNLFIMYLDSASITKYTQIYILTLFFRKMFGQCLLYERSTDEYRKKIFDPQSNKAIEVFLSRDEYVNSIVELIKKLDIETKKYIIKYLNDYVKILYPHINSKILNYSKQNKNYEFNPVFKQIHDKLFNNIDQNERENHNHNCNCNNQEEIPDCVICMDSINKNVLICDGCNNIFHLGCIVQWSKAKLYLKCPICQRFIHSILIVNPEEKYITYTLVLEKLST